MSQTYKNYGTFEVFKVGVNSIIFNDNHLKKRKINIQNDPKYKLLIDETTDENYFSKPVIQNINFKN